MKVSTYILAGSLAANLVVVALFVAGVREKSAPAAQREPPAPSMAAADPAAVAAGLWDEIRSDDARQQAENLRADGFPPALVRAIVSAQIRARFAQRRKVLEAAHADRPFWKNPTPDPATQAAFRALAREEQQAIRDVLGPDPDTGPAAILRRQLPGFSDETIGQLAAIRERYDQQRAELFAASPRALLSDDQAKIEALEQAQRREIAAVLTPQQLEDYELRTSNTANQLRFSLRAFDASEQEFRALYKLQSAFDEQFGQYRPGQGAQERQARRIAQTKLTEDIKATLGPERFADYQRGTDGQYRQTTQLVARLNLPPETANRLYAIQKEFEQRRSDLFRGSGGATPFETIRGQAATLQQEAIARVTPLLGSAQHVEAYKQYGGFWIGSLVARPPDDRPAPPKP
jgi:hypothetical protein